MINTLELTRFKSLTNHEPIQLTNMSILCGSNSSGKSSIIQALLMLSQTFSLRYFKSSISLNGHLVRLGSFSDILDYTSDENNIAIKIDLSFEEDGFWPSSFSAIHLDYTFGSKDEKHVKGYESQFHPTILKGLIKLTDREGREETLSFRELEPTNTNSESLYKLVSLNSKSKDLLEKEYPDYRIEGCDRQNIIPNNVAINYDHTKKLALQLVPFLIGGASFMRQIKTPEIIDLDKLVLPKSFFDKLRNLISTENDERLRNFVIPEDILSLIDGKKDKNLSLAKVKELFATHAIVLRPEVISKELLSEEGADIGTWRAFVSGLDEKDSKALFDFLIRNRDELQGFWYVNAKKNRRRTNFELSSFHQVDNYLSFYFERSVKYLGPLRNEPQAMYQAFDLTDPTKVGLKGEYTAAILHINKTKRVWYPAPSVLENNRLSFEIKGATLEQACTDWLTHLGVVTSVQTSDKGKLGYELLVKTTETDNWQDLTHVGVGVSQILPIVIMCLLAVPNDILIFEQPELHLHPKVQSRLCDFFIAISQRKFNA